MGAESLHPEAAQQAGEKDGLEAYQVVRYSGPQLPKSYHAAIYSGWKHSLRKGNDYFRLIRPISAFNAAYDLYIGRILSQPKTQVRLAVMVSDPDVVLGFSVSSGSLLHYVYVQESQRGHGIGRSLVPADIDTVSHLTRTGLTIWGSKFPKWIFNPFT